MHRGFINIYRKFTEWEWYTDTNTKALFLHLLLKANYKEKRWQGIAIEKGQYLTSILALAAETGLTIDKVRTCLKKLQSTGEITIKTTSKYTLINIVKYGFYQTETQTNPKQIPSKPQTSPKQTPTTKQEKKEKQVKKENNNNIAVEAKRKEERFVVAVADIQKIKEFIREPLTDKEIETILKVADSNIEKIKEKYSIVKSRDVRNLVGFLISAIKKDYTAPIESKGGKNNYGTGTSVGRDIEEDRGSQTKQIQTDWDREIEKRQREGKLNLEDDEPLPF